MRPVIRAAGLPAGDHVEPVAPDGDVQVEHHAPSLRRTRRVSHSDTSNAASEIAIASTTSRAADRHRPATGRT